MSERPNWWYRQYLDPFVLSEEEAWEIINRPPWFCVISWVTKDCEPVCCEMAYVVLDGKITLTSTRNRDKVKAFQRNPAVSLCFHGRGFKQVTVRGHVEFSDDATLLRRWIEAHVDSWGRNFSPAGRDLQIERYNSPDRVLLIILVDKLRTFDGEKMFLAEKESPVDENRS